MLATALIFPWWSETESSAGSRWIQSYSALTGVTGTCRPECPSFGYGPPLGPINGRESFVAAGLNETGMLYTVVLGLVAAGMAGTIAVTVYRWWSRETTGPDRRRRVVLLHSFALAGAAAGAALLPLVQSMTLRADTLRMPLNGGDAWTASPSPETSFWGSCSAGTYHGLCASGGSAEWGPGLGWVVLLAAVVILAVLLVRTTHVDEAAPSPDPAPSEDPAPGDLRVPPSVP